MLLASVNPRSLPWWEDRQVKKKVTIQCDKGYEIGWESPTGHGGERDLVMVLCGREGLERFSGVLKNE